MTSEFEWQVEEEGSEWEIQPNSPLPGKAGRGPGLMLMVGLLLVGVVALLFWQLDGRAAEAESDLQNELMALQQLIEQLAQEADDELFRSVMSGRDGSWSQAQIHLLVAGQLFDRPAFGLRLQAEAAPAQVTFSPDLFSAEVVKTRIFLAELEGNRTLPVTLEQTAIYRKGEQRWLYSPPKREFWGEWRTQHHKRLSLAYPARDEAIAVRLASDLDAKIAQMCQALPDINCPPGWRIWLRFKTDPNSLLVAGDLETMLQADNTVELPTPTLVGIPADEAAYQALFRGYGALLVSALIPQLVDYDCCWRGLFFRALLDKQLSQLALKPWPLTQVEYDSLIRRPFRWTNVYGDWNNDALQLDRNWRQVYSLIDFIQEANGGSAPLGQMQRDLRTIPGRYLSWARAYLPEYDEVNHFAVEWLRYIYSKSTSGGMASPPVPLPDQRLQLVCGIGPRESATLYQYDLATQRWIEEFSHQDIFGLITPLSNGDYLVYQRLFDSDRVESRTMLWSGDEQILVSEALKGQFESRRGLYFAAEDPTGRYGVLVAFGNPGQADQFQLLNPERCSEQECQLSMLLSIPAWSPTGNFTLQVGPIPNANPGRIQYRDQLQAPIFLGDEQGQSRRFIAQGNLPFWISDHYYGYLRHSGQDAAQQGEVVLASVRASDSPSVLLRPEELLEAISPSRRPRKLYILSLAAQPSGGRFLAVTAATSPERGTGSGFAFLVELSAELTGVKGISLMHAGERTVSTTFSPSGQWLTVFTNDGPGNVIHLFDVTGNGATTIGSNGRWADWSADGQWVAQRYDDYLTLLAPAHDYQQIIFQDFSDCRAIGWTSAS